MLKIQKKSEKTNKQFLDRINNFQFDTNQKLVSFDVSSLFTNAPLEDTIQLTTKSICDSKHQDVKQQINTKRHFYKTTTYNNARNAHA